MYHKLQPQNSWNTMYHRNMVYFRYVIVIKMINIIMMMMYQVQTCSVKRNEKQIIIIPSMITTFVHVHFLLWVLPEWCGTQVKLCWAEKNNILIALKTFLFIFYPSTSLLWYFRKYPVIIFNLFFFYWPSIQVCGLSTIFETTTRHNIFFIFIFL